MSVKFEIPAEIRTEQGKGASRRLRRLADKVPAILYGGEQDSVALSVSHDYLIKALEHEAFYSHILTVKFDGKTEKAVLKDLQRHAYKPRVLHMDLLRINANEPLTMRVPLHFIGEELAPGVKLGGGIISHLMSDVEIRCLPADLPEYIEVDLSTLEVDQILHLSDIKVAANIQIVALTQGADHDLPVASIHKPRGADTETTAETA